MSITLADFWPTKNNCRDCLITAAESASDAVFLAVHQSMPLSRRLLSSTTGESETKTEKDLLDAFLTDNLPSGTLILPIVGSSGVGKSHMIRWLDANVRRRKDGVNRHIVRIPRSSSLRRVLELILDANGANVHVDSLLSQSRYRELNKTLTSATLPPTLQVATHELRGKLLIALEGAYQEASARLASGDELPDDRARRAHCSESNLPALLQDPVIGKHFMAYQGEDLDNYGVLARIASRCIDGQRDVNDASSFFTEEDLVVDTSFDRADMTALARKYLTGLERRGGAKREEAVKYLNELVDDAISQLLAFSGFSLTDLFVEIRKCLLQDNIELILLIEDFAALAGIQGSLLDAIISEGVRGDQELCTMRTALAVTEGYLSNRETVSTRAGYEWKIADYPFSSEAEAVQSYSNFIAGYLNAARWGKDDLEIRYRKSGGVLDEWLPDYYESKRDDLGEDDASTIAAFGLSESGGVLFPFNEGSIRQLINRYLKEGDSYKFNPRELINRVLHGTLSDFRGLFEERSFPPEGFQGFQFRLLETSVSEELRSRVGPELNGRMSAFVYYWGDNPRTVGQAANIDSRIYSAFNLETVDWSAKPEKRDELVGASTPDVSSRGSEAHTLTPEEKKVASWKDLLRKWKEEGIISQGRANDIRSMIIDSAWEYVDWNVLLLVRPEVTTSVRARIRLPKVTHNNPEEKDAIIVALSDESWEIPESVDQFFRAMSAMCSFSVYRSWDYEGGERDSASYANYVEKISIQVTTYYLKQFRQLPREGLVPLAKTLLIGARILNLPGANSKKRSDNVLAICSSGNGVETQHLDGKWWDLYNQALSSRQTILDLLNSQIVARQGSGDKILAVDATVLLRAIEELKDTWSLGDDFDLSVFRDQSAMVKSHVRSIKTDLKPAMAERLSELSEWNELMGTWIPEKYNYSEIRDTCFESIRMSRKASEFRCGETSSDVLKRRITDLEDIKVSAEVSLVHDAKESGEFGQRLTTVARVDQKAVSTTATAFTLYEQFLTETEEAVEERINKAPLNIKTAAEEKISQIEEIESLWARLEGGNS